MKKTQQPFSSFIQFQAMYPDEQSCIRLLEQARWGDTPVCTRCGHGKVYRLKGGKLLKCAGCKERFSVKLGTIFEESRLPLNKWMYVMYLFANHRKGLSSHQVGRDIGVTRNAVVGKVRRLDLSYRRQPAEPVARRIHALENWKHKTCAFPHGDPGDEDFRFCGKDVVHNLNGSPSPYCQEHYDLCYLPRTR